MYYGACQCVAGREAGARRSLTARDGWAAGAWRSPFVTGANRLRVKPMWVLGVEQALMPRNRPGTLVHVPGMT